MNVSISDAARLAGVSRQTLYDRINSGTLSRTAEGIDVAELTRVYPDLKPLEVLRLKKVKKPDLEEGREAANSTELLAAREREIEWLREELAERKRVIEKRNEAIERKDRELTQAAERLHESNQQWQDTMESARQDFTKLLEAPKPRKKILGIF